ncbi:histidine kinase [Streptomyces sp. NPDC002851]
MRIRALRGRSDFDRVELYTRGAVHAFVWVSVLVVIALSVTRPVRHAAPWPLIAAVVLLSAAQGVWSTRLVKASFDERIGRGSVPRWRAGAGAALMVAVFAGVLALAAATGYAEFPALYTAVGVALVPFVCGYCLLVRVWTALLVVLAVSLATCGVMALAGADVTVVVPSFFGMAYMGGIMAPSVRCSAWVLGVMYELREARDVQARLAVAEERLRFGRDLHDVLGRNLAVVALKSELAVQLARRGRPEAVDQMTEVQRIAQESQREVREVVRGYRETGLEAELAGAQGVLTAAGITCRVLGADAARALPASVHSALGWVVREAATNVLRHGDAEHCSVVLSVTEGRAELIVENDGVRQPAQGRSGGSGLVGLRERLAEVNGELTAGPVRGGRFRLRAEVPVGEAGDGRDERGTGGVRDEQGAGDVRDEQGAGDVRDDQETGDVRDEQRTGDVRDEQGTGGVRDDQETGDVRDEQRERRASSAQAERSTR